MATTSTTTPHTILSTSNVQLETLVHQAQGHNNTTEPTRVLIFVHPWGKLGGSWHNTNGLAQLCSRQHGYTSIVFNLRGVGNSTGNATCCGHSEVNDIVSVAEWAIQQYIGADIWLVAQSAGAPSAGTAVKRLGDQCRGAIFIWYTFGCASAVLFGRHFKHAASFNPTQRALFLVGTRDCFTTPKTMVRAAKRNRYPSTVVLFDGVGHFEIEASHFDGIVSSLAVQFIQQNTAQGNGTAAMEQVLAEHRQSGKVMQFGATEETTCCCCPPCSYCDTCTCCVMWCLLTIAVVVVLIVLSSQNLI